MASRPGGLPPGYRVRYVPGLDDDDPLVRLRARVPDLITTSGWRSEEHNRRVDGVANSEHLDADATDLVSPRLGMRRLRAIAAEEFGPDARVINEGDHVHAQLPGWHNAPGTPFMPEGYAIRDPAAPRPQAGAFPHPRPNFGTSAPPLTVPASPQPHHLDPEIFRQQERLQLGHAPLARWSALDNPDARREAAQPRPQGDLDSPGTVEVMPDDPIGTHAAVTDNPEALRAALGELQAMFDGGAPIERVTGRARALGVLENSPHFLADLREAYRVGSARFVPGAVRRVRPDNPNEPSLTSPAEAGAPIVVTASRSGQPVPAPREMSAADLPLYDPSSPLSESARATAYRPSPIIDPFSEGFGSAAAAVTGGDRYTESGQSQNMRDFLGAWWNPVLPLDWAAQRDREAQRASAEGRPLDALGHNVMAGGNLLLAAPIFGLPGRGGNRLAGRALSELEELARRGGVTDFGPGSDDIIARLANEHWQALTPPTREALQSLGTGEGISGASIGQLRSASAARGGAPPAAGAAEQLPPGYAVRSVPGELPGTTLPQRMIRPEDVRPIPGNRIESPAELDRLNPPSTQPVHAPPPETALEMRTYAHPISGKPVRFRGPLDAEAYLRSRGGVRDDGGELSHLGIANNAGRPEMKGESRLGPILNPSGMGLDEAGEALWSAGYFRERPTTSDVLEALRSGRFGRDRALWHPNDLGEVERFGGAQAQHAAAQAAEQEGRPLANLVGEPIGLDDLDAMAPPLSAYEDAPRFVGRVGNLNLANVENPEEVSRLVQAIEGMVQVDPAARGLVTNNELRLLAHETNVTPDDIIRWNGGSLPSPERLYAMRVIVHQGRQRLVAMARRARGATDEDLARFHNMIVAQTRLEQGLSRITSETGRALQQYRMIAAAGDQSDAAIKAYLRRAGGRENVEDIAERLIDLVEDPAAAGRFIRGAVKTRKRDMVNELWVNSLLSGPRTHIVNFVSNALTAAYSVPEHALTAAIGAVTRSPDRARAGEIPARIAGMIQGAREGVALMRQTFRTGEPSDAVSKIEAVNYEAIPGRLGHVIRTPSRALMAADELWKSVNRRAAINEMAFRRAAQAGGSREQRLARYNELRIDPDEPLRRYADARARYFTFQAPLGPGGRSVQQFANEVPGAKMVMPFVRTPINLLKFAAERNVVTAPFMREFREAWKAGGNARNEAIAKVIMGTGISAFAVTEAASGRISGGGPRNAEERAALMNSGWQPYSVRIGDRWVSYQRFEPLSLLVGAAADFAEIGAYAAPEEADAFAMSMATAVATNITSKTWLSGLSDFFDALSDPDRYGERFVQRLAASAAVPAISAHAAQAVDPNLREAHSILEAVRARVPVVSRGLEHRLNVWGEPITRGSGGGRVTVGSAAQDFVSPVFTQRVNDSPLLREAARLRVRVPMPQRYITVRRERIDLTTEQHNAYIQLSGRPGRQYLESYMRRPEWRRLNDDERRQYIRETMEHYRDTARDELLTMYPEMNRGLPVGYTVRRGR